MTSICKIGVRNDLKILAMVAVALISVSMLLSFIRASGDTGSNEENYIWEEYEDNITIPFEDFAMPLDNETMPFCLGKNMSVLIRNITQTHRENLLRIRLQRRIMLNNTWHERLRVLNQTKNEMRNCIEERNREMERLREMLRNGNITREEFIMEMNRISLEVRTRLSLLKETSKEALKALQENISEENKKFAKQIVEENQRFQQEMKQLHERVREEVKERVREEVKERIREQAQNKDEGKGKNTGKK
ncbi:MAG: hypothetical protein QXR97_05210 [Thermoproteota archaeon]